jgi:hypothetical protein
MEVSFVVHECKVTVTPSPRQNLCFAGRMFQTLIAVAENSDICPPVDLGIQNIFPPLALG